MYDDAFGYLPLDVLARFNGGKICRVVGFEEVLKTVEQWTCIDGYIYPGIDQTAYSAGRSPSNKVGCSAKHAVLHRLPATHMLCLEQQFSDKKEARYGVGGFLIHFLGFLYGYRCQFADWWFDGRVSTRAQNDHNPPRQHELNALLDLAVSRWNHLSIPQQVVAINALYLHSRTFVYELEWERFQAEYQVFDAAFSLARTVGHILAKKKISHGDRMRAVCERYSIPFDAAKVSTIVKLRNQLLHEAIWDGRMPGEARSETSALAPLWVNRLTRRLLLGALGFEGKYISGAWWTLSQCRFDISLPIR